MPVAMFSRVGEMLSTGRTERKRGVDQESQVRMKEVGAKVKAS